MKIAVYCGAACGNNPVYQEAAIAFGQWIGRNGHQLVYGGGNVGLMGELADAVMASGGQVVGVMPQFLIDREIAHDQLTELIKVETMSQRKQMMLDRSDVCVALPGGPGTLEEIVEAISWLRVGQSSNPCLFLNVNHYYDGIQVFYQHMVNEGFLTLEDYQRIGFVECFEEIEDFVEGSGKMQIRDYK